MPVVLIHGSGLDSSYWSEMIAALRAAGYPPEAVAAVDLVPSDGDNVAAARGPIADAVERLLAERAGTAAAPRKVDIVAHSMGAFSGRWYAAKIAPEKVRRFVAIAGANHGTDALCGMPGEGNRQMCPAFSDARGSAQAALNGTRRSPADPTPFGVGEDPPGYERVPPDAERAIAYITLRVENDPWIVPAESAVLAGAGGLALEAGPRIVETGPGNYLIAGAVGHDDVVLERRAIEFVLSVLRADPAE